MRGKTASFDEAIQSKTLIYRIFLIIFWITVQSTTTRNDKIYTY
ncbi:hypothetical protein RFEPED_1185 [Rickettsia felis str. Pedreira]|uniref:Uncharacterized protein n=1 Tax=Rickettsia felis str. Pedreira TaxID=1359196 RepID=A0A0F3MTM0_RICFI|nr:hypothetical protein [Rickettsia felis]KJV58792.1 hypothetical protein RFEPED_1185 [Rickettsia felis str. Pedreira]